MRNPYEYLVCLTLLAACAGGTMRVAQDEEDDSEPVALAPAPEADPDSMPTPEPESTPQDSVPHQPAPESQGYSPYGGSTDVEFRRVGQWTRTGISEARRLVIRDANAWAEFWSELGVGDRPEVDFSRDLVVVVAAGQRPTGGHEIAVDRVSQDNSELTISVVETTPGPNCMTTTSLTQPVDVVVVPKVSARTWSFLEHKEVRGCR
jgi:PrcB C-terminal